MCLHRRQLDSKSRRIMAAGYLCLVLSLLPSLFYAHGIGLGHAALFDSVRFLFLGAAIGLLSWFARRGCGRASRS
jgi:hypothetical protein